jgi:hypothetical protein
MNLAEIMHGYVRAQQRGRPFPAKQRSKNPMEQDPKHIESNLPIPIEDDFDPGATNDRLIQGTIIRCVDGRWADRDGVSFPNGTQMLVLGTTKAVQRWQDKVPVETFTERPLPDIALLNEAVPKDQWEEGLNGPRPPYVLQHIAYLIDPRDASIYTFINSTTGAAIAVERLTQKVHSMRLLRGQKVSPIVKLDAKPMTTKFGQKMRPEFVIVDWRDLGCGGLGKKPAPQLGKPVKPVSVAEELNDELPF